MFTVEQRNALRARMLQLAEEDERVVAGAAVGSLAVGSGDRFSDLDPPSNGVGHRFLSSGLRAESVTVSAQSAWGSSAPHTKRVRTPVRAPGSYPGRYEPW